MDKIISSALADGKYVTIGIHQDAILGIPNIKDFDASVCTQVYGWSGDECSATVKGQIVEHAFPAGYMPELTIQGTRYNYHHPGESYDVPISSLYVTDSKELLDAYEWYQAHKDDKSPPAEHRNVYRWDSYSGDWRESGTYTDTAVEQIVGLEDIYKAILRDVNILFEKKEQLEQLGMAPAVNVLLTSAPGRGKTSLIRTLATSLNAHIHTLTADSFVRSSPETIFKSTADNGPLTIYVFEDFDRYLDKAGNSQMASFLNAIDGVEKMPTSLRIFTSNSQITGEKIEAFLSRMRRVITLTSHSSEAYRRSISIIYPHMEEEKVASLLEFFRENDLTMRQANNLLCASIVYDDPVSYILGVKVATLTILASDETDDE